jgi:hypothetical protein
VKVRTPNKPAIILIAVAVLTAGGLYLLLQPQRSADSFCRVYHQENQKLAHAQGSTYSAAVFDHHSGNPQDFAAAFSELDRVAPSSIEPDVRTLRNLFQTIKDDPAKGFSASLGAVGADLSVRNWTISNCGK